jgi:hypothetical protein
MKKMLIFIVLVMVSTSTFADNWMPLSDKEWVEDKYNINHHGLKPSEWYGERRVTIPLEGFGDCVYFLYDTYSRADGYMDYESLALEWIEDWGYVPDYDDFIHVSPNPDLANSIKQAMRRYGKDVAMAIFVNDDDTGYVVVNNYYADENTYFSDFYYFHKSRR